MPKQSSETLMRGFIANLDNTGNLEDAVDVADSYSSINDKKLQSTILGYVMENEKVSTLNNNSRGRTIYSLLKSIFLSADSTNNIDLTGILGIPSIYEISYSRFTGTEMKTGKNFSRHSSIPFHPKTGPSSPTRNGMRSNRKRVMCGFLQTGRLIMMPTWMTAPRCT